MTESGQSVAMFSALPVEKILARAQDFFFIGNFSFFSEINFRCENSRSCYSTGHSFTALIRSTNPNWFETIFNLFSCNDDWRFAISRLSLLHFCFRATPSCKWTHTQSILLYRYWMACMYNVNYCMSKLQKINEDEKNDFDKKKCVVIDLFFEKKKNQQQLEEKSRPASFLGSYLVFV